jgi:hypothetical protein
LQPHRAIVSAHCGYLRSTVSAIPGRPGSLQPLIGDRSATPHAHRRTHAGITSPLSESRPTLLSEWLSELNTGLDPRVIGVSSARGCLVAVRDLRL